jgi:hypothetical protein
VAEEQKNSTVVMAGLDPAIHLLREKCFIKIDG